MFGQQSTSAGTTSTPSLFGSTAPSSGQQAGGFSFGNTGASAGLTSGGGFSFGQTTAAPKTGGFSFGGIPAQTQAQAQTQSQATPSFSFGGNAAAAPKPAGGFSFGSTPASTQAQPAPGFSLGGASSGGFNFGDTTKQPAAPAGSFGFVAPTGSTTTTAAAPATQGGFNLGGLVAPGTAASGGLMLGQASASVAPQISSAASTPAGGFNLGGGGGGGFTLGGVAPSATATISATPGFGGTVITGAAVQPTQTAISTAAGGGLGGGLGGGMKLGGFSLPTTTTQSIATAASTGLKLGIATPSASGGLTLGTSATTTPSLGGGLKLGGLGTKPATGLNLGTGASSAATIPSTGLGLLGAKPTTTATAASGMGLGLGTVPTSTAGVTAPMATMSYRELEECINKWTVELDEQEKSFLQQAAQVNAWDRTLVNNGEKITSLHNDLETVKTDQQRLEHELDYIVAQQRELEDIVVPLEEACKTQEGSLYRQHTDVERERTYRMSENIDSQLKRMVQDLKEIIDHMNTSSTPSDQADPINQVAKILNAHMNSLQWIDQNTSLVQRKVDEVTRQYEIVKRDQERNVHLAFE